MDKYESITYKELKKIMKLSITINIELGFYISYTQKYIVIDQWENKCKDRQRLYIFNREDMPNIIKIVHAHSKLHKRKLSVW